LLTPEIDGLERTSTEIIYQLEAGQAGNMVVESLGIANATPHLFSIHSVVHFSSAPIVPYGTA
jgi:hypothetical protein